jgi:SPP1 family predicted phage head-tail adaptor
MTAGEYQDRLKWLKRTTTKDQYGQDVESFTNNGYLWAAIEVTTGRKSVDHGGEQTGAEATIRVRQYPTLSALDRLESEEWNELWIIDHMRRGDNELIVEAIRYDQLEL